MPIDRRTRTVWATLALVLALATATRVWTVGKKNVWIDEVASWTEATYPVRQMLASVAGDVHPPLYYLMLKGWIALAGDTAIALRAPSVAFGVLIVLLTWLLARRWLSPPVRVATVVWVAVAPHLVFYAQEARMYAPATAAVLAACLAYRRWTESRFENSRALIALGVAMVVALYLHYFTALVALALWMHLPFAIRDIHGADRTVVRVSGAPRTGAPYGRIWRHWLLAHVAILLAYLPWASVAAAQISRGQPWRESISLLQLPRYLFVLAADFATGYHLQWSQPIAVAGMLIVVVMIVGWIRLVAVAIRDRGEHDLFLVLTSAVPVSASLLALLLTGHMALSRYLAYLLPFLTIGVARGLAARDPGPARPVALLALVSVASAACLFSYYRDPIRDFDVRPVVRALKREAAANGPGRGVVLLDPGFLDICIKYYWREPPVRQERVAPDVNRWDVVAAAMARDDGPVWLVVARDSVSFDPSGVPEHLRLQEVVLEPSWPDRIRLLRVLRTR